MQRPSIREVWAYNLDREMENIRAMLMTHPNVAVYSVYPGMVGRPLGKFKSDSHLYHQTIVANVNMMDPLQVCLTLLDEDGEYSADCATWQFNFAIDLQRGVFLKSSLDLLKRTGLDPDKHEKEGIKHDAFAVALTTSGLVLNPDVAWITSEGSFHIAYLLSMLMGEDVPFKVSEFFEFLRLYFPRVYDVRTISRSVRTLGGSLNDLAEKLKIPTAHIVASNAAVSSILAGKCFFAMKKLYFENEMDDRHLGLFYQLEDVTPAQDA